MRYRTRAFSVVAMIMVTAVARAAVVSDPHSFSTPDAVSLVHLDAKLNVDFGAKTVTGEALWKLDRKVHAAPLVLDTKGLEILGLESGGKPLKYTLATERPILGSQLEITLPAGVEPVIDSSR